MMILTKEYDLSAQVDPLNMLAETSVIIKNLQKKYLIMSIYIDSDRNLVLEIFKDE